MILGLKVNSAFKIRYFHPKGNECVMNGYDSIKNMIIHKDASKHIFFVFLAGKPMTGDPIGQESNV
jgi:hypothetical protein